VSTFNNFAALKAAIKEWANRDDLSDALLTSFVRLGEEQIGLFLRSRFNRKTLRVFVTTNGLITVPSDYIELHTMQPMGTWNGVSTSTFAAASAPAMISVSYDSMTSYSDSLKISAPTNFALLPDASAWFVYPQGNWAIDVSYYATLQPLTDTVQPELFVQHGGIYLIAALVEVENYLKLSENERGPWRDKLNAYITQLNTNQRRSQMSGSTPVTRAPYR
jgi:hypothetical protein